MIKRRKYLIDLFSGCGGISLGFSEENYICKLAIDSWEPALYIHGLHHKSKHLLSCLGAKINNKREECLNHEQLLFEILKVVKMNERVHIHASPPCQQLSSINSDRTNNIKLTKWSLDFFMKWIPKNWTWTIEQVDHPKVKQLYDTQKDIFYQTIDMSDFGISQSRKRLICSNVDLFDELYKLQEQNSLREVISIPRDAKYIANGNFSVRKWKENSKAIAVRKLDSKTIGYTVVTTPAWFLNHNLEPIRAFTVQENVLLQTFPKNYFINVKKYVKVAELNTIIANAVPPKFVAKLALAMDRKLNKIL